MTGLPTVTVALDDGTGTFPIDVSSRTEGDASISSYGRTDEFSTAQPATLNLKLDNTDGALTVGSGFGFGLGLFGLGGFGGVGAGGLITPGRRIRCTFTVGATTRNRFTGRIVSAPLGWPGGSQSRSLVEITAVDPIADAARKTLRSMLEQEILLRSPALYYTFAETLGATTAGDTSGSQQPALLPQNTGTGASQVTGILFGVNLGLPSGELSGVQFTGNGFATTGFRSVGGTWSSSSVSITFVVACDTVGGPLGSDWNPVGVSGSGASGGVRIDDFGRVVWQGATSPLVTDGRPHIVTVRGGGGGLSDVWVDGVLVAATSSVVATWSNASVSVIGNITAGVKSTIGQVAIGPRLSNGDVVSIHAAATGALETTAV